MVDPTRTWHRQTHPQRNATCLPCFCTLDIILFATNYEATYLILLWFTASRTNNQCCEKQTFIILYSIEKDVAFSHDKIHKKSDKNKILSTLKWEK